MTMFFAVARFTSSRFSAVTLPEPSETIVLDGKLSEISEGQNA